MSVSGSCPPDLHDAPHLSDAAHSDPAPGAARAIPPLDPPGWQSAAACAGLPPRVVFSKKVKEAAPALRACVGCPVRRNCEKAVAPADNWFDGVCGGRLWRRGRPVQLPADFVTPTGVHRAVPVTGPHAAHDGGRVA
ncbi:WhiB family transcriptional regulator [Streptomyces sp. NPDC052301]|uniref:WhiB family transcriptional regulator n=1 Tax=Streptomyces sp. NPDC052301 TaxID=3365687 RepID=UPI0037D55A9F